MNRNIKTTLWLLVIFIITAAILYIFFDSTTQREQPENNEINISVSIPPIKYLVDRISGNTLNVNTILPPGSSPETYEPTPRNLKSLENSSIIFVIGLIDFENTIVNRSARRSSVIKLITNNMELIDGHDHHHDKHSHHHNHGYDPHIWVSPTYLRFMADVIYKTLSGKHPNDLYAANYQRLIEDLDELDKFIGESISSSGVSAFMIYHPALSYYARDYGLEQIQLEHDGKEPSAEKLRATVNQAKTNGIDKILYQKEFNIKTVETIAKDLDATPVEIDPLDEDILTTLMIITEIIAPNA